MPQDVAEVLDLKREWKDLYTARRKPDIIEVPERRGLAVEERRLPGADTIGPMFTALYHVAYTMKFAIKKGRGVNYQVMAPEAIYRTADFDPRVTEWRWQAAVAIPSIVTPSDLKGAVAAVRAKHGDVPLLDQVKIVKLPAGTQGRILHVGPYDQEQETIARLQAFVQEQGYRLGSRHIEVYLSDPARVPPERIRTVIRYPLLKRR